MLGSVVAHEARQLFRDRVGLAALVVLTGALAGGLVTGFSLQRKQETVRAGVQEANDRHFRLMRAQLEAVAAGRKPEGFFSANRVTALRYSVPRPVSPLTPLSVGLSEYLPGSAQVGLFSSPYSQFQAAAIDNPQNQHIGRFDLAFVLVYILPLLLVVLTHNLLSVERERGTLPLLLNQPAGLFRILLSKALVPYLLLAVPAAVVPVIAMLALSSGTAAHTLNLVFFGVLTLGYALFWVALAIAVNLLGLRSSANALLLGSLWLAFVLVLPATLQVALDAFYPLPSRLELVSRARVAEVENGKKRKEITDRFYQDHPELVPEGGKENRILAFYATFLETEKATQGVHAQFDQQLSAQQAWVRRLQFLSPAVVFREGLAAAAGTGTDSFADFRVRIQRFQAQVKDFVLPRVVQARDLTLADYQQAPVFKAGGAEGAALPWAGLAGLLLPSALLLLWAWRRAGSIESIFMKG